MDAELINFYKVFYDRVEWSILCCYRALKSRVFTLPVKQLETIFER